MIKSIIDGPVYFILSEGGNISGYMAIAIEISGYNVHFLVFL